MTNAVECFFDFGSPTSYLAWTQLPRIAAAAGARSCRPAAPRIRVRVLIGKCGLKRNGTP